MRWCGGSSIGDAGEQIAGDEYITANRALDRDLERLTREKALELVAVLQSPQLR